MAEARVKLVNPIEGHEGQVKEIVLREPKFGDLMALGEPTAFAYSEGGLAYTAEKDDVIKAYILRLLQQPKDPVLLEQLSLADTLQVKEAVFSFFQTARRAATTPQK